jgi:diacylglycerol kinase family enzyme
VGGDGTVHEVANGLLRQGGAAAAALGVVPIGSGNDFAKLVGVYRHSPVRAVRRLVTSQTVPFDVGRAGAEYFVNSMGVGFGPAVIRNAERDARVVRLRIVLRPRRSRVRRLPSAASRDTSGRIF